MSAVYYVLLSCLMGYLLMKLCLPSLFDMKDYICLSGKPVKIARWLVIFPGSFLTGTLILTWCVYIAAYLLRNTGRPLYYANIIVMLFFTVAVGVLIFFLSYKKGEEKLKTFIFGGTKASELIFVTILLAVTVFLMFLTFRVEGKNIIIGLSVFSDFSPHMAMIRSFSHGLNFPTEYPFYADGTVRYHFMFQFLAGNLEFLGLRFDWAFNLPSILGYASFVILLYVLAVVITGRRTVGFLTCVLFFFRSSMAFFTYMKDLLSSTASLNQQLYKIFIIDEFIGKTPNEYWGLWNQDVFVNQRHLAFALGIMVLIILAVYPLFTEMLSSLASCRKSVLENENGTNGYIDYTESDVNGEIITGSGADIDFELNDNGIATAVENENIGIIMEHRNEVPEDCRRIDYKAEIEQAAMSKHIVVYRKVDKFLFFSESWLPQSIVRAVALGLILGMLSFWNGAVVFAALTVLFALAVMSSHRLEYLILATIAIGISYIETAFFIGNGTSAVKPLITFGFIAPNKSITGILAYLIELTGLLPFVVAAAMNKPQKGLRWICLAFIMPMLFAFTVQLTPDIVVNHKYVMIAVLLLDIIAADFIVRLYRVKFTKVLAVMLAAVMTVTGVVDMFTLVNINNPNNIHGKRPFVISLEDPLTKWVEENTGPNEVFLTNTYFIHPLLISGRKIFLGWHYFSWSAGYDTLKREKIAQSIFNAQSSQELLKLMKENRLTYVLVDNDLRKSQVYKVNEKLLADTLKTVYDNKDTSVKIYKSK